MSAGRGAGSCDLRIQSGDGSGGVSCSLSWRGGGDRRRSLPARGMELVAGPSGRIRSGCRPRAGRWRVYGLCEVQWAASRVLGNAPGTERAAGAGAFSPVRRSERAADEGAAVRNKHIAVLGAGPAGAAAALGLMRLGYQVTVISDWRRFNAIEGTSERVMHALRTAGLRQASATAISAAHREVYWAGQHSVRNREWLLERQI